MNRIVVVLVALIHFVAIPSRAETILRSDKTVSGGRQHTHGILISAGQDISVWVMSDRRVDVFVKDDRGRLVAYSEDEEPNICGFRAAYMGVYYVIIVNHGRFPVSYKLRVRT